MNTGWRVTLLVAVAVGVSTCQAQDAPHEGVSTVQQGLLAIPKGLGPNEALLPGQSLQSLNGRYTFTLQTDGNMVLSAVQGTLWSSGPFASPEYLVMQGDGNLVLYDLSGAAVWNTGAQNNSGARFAITNDGGAVVYKADGTESWATRQLQTTILGPDQSLLPGQSLMSPDGHYTFKFQADGNLLLRRNDDGSKMWASNTPQTTPPAVRLTMQADGNLVLYPAVGSAIWYTGTNKPGSDFGPRSGGNANVRTPQFVIQWSTSTYSSGLATTWSSMLPTAGSGTAGPHQADSTPALQQLLSAPAGITGSWTGKTFVADTDNNMILQIPSSLSTADQWDTAVSPDRDSRNLIVNPSAEMVDVLGQIPGWTIVQGGWHSDPLHGCTPTLPCPPDPAFDGAQFFSAGYQDAGADQEIYQDVDLPFIGTMPFAFTAYARSADERDSNNNSNPDRASIMVEFRDANNTVLDTLVSQTVTNVGRWGRVYGRKSAPSGTKRARIRLLAHRVTSSGSNDVYFDGLSLVRWTSKGISSPRGILAPDSQASPSDSLYIADSYNHRVVQLTGTGAAYTVVAGQTETPGSALTQLDNPRGLARLSNGDLLIADYNNDRVMKLHGTTMTVLVGNSVLKYPSAVAVDSSNNVYITDKGHHCIRKVDASGNVTTFAGNPYDVGGYYGDGGAATDAYMLWPDGLMVAPDNSVYVADSGNHTIRRIKGGIIDRVAGQVPDRSASAFWTGPGNTGDNGPARSSRLNFPVGLYLRPSNGLIYIADQNNNRIRMISCDDGNKCDGAETYNASLGECGSGAIAVLNDNNACTFDKCDPATGTVTHVPIAFDDADACTTDTCTASQGVRHVPMATGTTCDDQNPCTVSDTCQAGSGVCRGTARIVPNDNNPCTVDACDPNTGQFPIPNEGAACSCPVSGCTCNGSGACEAPPPTLVVPPLDQTQATLLGPALKFIYDPVTGVQKGVTANAIDDKSAALVSGKVRDAAGQPIGNAVVKFKNAPQYGSTSTRADGQYDLVVNGTQNLILHVERNTYFSVDRTVSVDRNQTLKLDDIVLKRADFRATAVTLGGGGIQEASSSVSNDADGQRQMVAMVPPNTDADVLYADGSTAPLTSMKLRMTEYTVGPDGHAAMPGPLPPTTAYTYATEISADEALADPNAKSVEFSQPVPFYVDNFLGMKVGETVPAGYYDKDKQAWIPSDINGVVIKVIGVEADIASIDATGDDKWDSSDVARLGATLSTDELTRLANRYRPGDTLWRVPVRHLTPWDCNWPYGPPACETQGTPQVCPGGTGVGSANVTSPCEHQKRGSIIECETQGLGERLPVAGTPFSLNYRSTNQPGYQAKRQIHLVLTGPQIHSKLKRVDLVISVAGKTFTDSVSKPPANYGYDFTWSGLDKFDRPVVGTMTANVKITSVYPAVYYSGGQFAAFSQNPGTPVSIEGDRDANEIRYPVEFTVPLSTRAPTDGWSLNGWTLSEHHFFDSGAGLLYRGDGTARRLNPDGYVVHALAGNGSQNYGVDDGNASSAGFFYSTSGGGGLAVSAKGEVYVADSGHHVVRMIDPQGLVHRVAGTADTLQACYLGATLGDGGPATSAHVGVPLDLALAADGSLYISDGLTHSVRRVAPDKTISTVVGSATCPPQAGSSGDGGPAVNALLKDPEGIALAADGTLFIADTSANLIRKVDRNGIISAVAGTGDPGGSWQQRDNVRATAAVLGSPMDVAVAADGTLYIALAYELLSVHPDGIMRHVSGPFDQTERTYPVLDGLPVALHGIDYWLSTVAADPKGRVIYNDTDLSRSPAPDGQVHGFLRMVDNSGIVNSISVGIANTSPVDGAPALRNGPSYVSQIAPGPENSIVFTTSSDNRVYSLEKPNSRGLAACNNAQAAYLIPDGQQSYCFDATGRHLSTLNTDTLQQVYSFGYSGGVLATIGDAAGNVTQVVRGGGGYNIVAPFGQTTNVGVTNGYVTSIGDVSGTAHFSNSTEGEGLLGTYTDKRGGNFEFHYDTTGRLHTDRGGIGTIYDSTQTLDW